VPEIRATPSYHLGVTEPATTAEVVCPYCSEPIDLYIDPETAGSYVEDCAVCCRPWQVHVARDEDGELSVMVERAQ
jgi:hypothetical protein